MYSCICSLNPVVFVEWDFEEADNLFGLLNVVSANIFEFDELDFEIVESLVSSQNFRVKCKNLVFCTRKVEIYNLIYPVLLRGYRFTIISYV